MAWGRRGGRGHGTRGGQKCQNDQKSERVTDGFGGIFAIARNFYVKKFEFFSELLRAHAAPGAACALRL